MKKLFVLILVLCLTLIVLAILFFRKDNTDISNPALRESNAGLEQKQFKQVVSPIDKSDQRVTKKPFGIHITPKNSPIQPEKFTGFHAGTDFETFPEEAGVDVSVYAICDGKILQKTTATGYGGVLIQSCTINNQAVTVIYGHVKLISIAKSVGESFARGEKIGLLGQPPAETSGERKHLHLGIHKGSTVDIKGYVQSQSELANWLDWQELN